MTTKDDELDAFKKALLAQDLGRCLNTLCRKGCDERRILEWLKGLPNLQHSNVLEWPDWIDVNKLDSILRLLRTLRKETASLNKTAFRPFGWVADGVFDQAELQAVAAFPKLLDLYQRYFEFIRWFAKKGASQRSRQFRAIVHSGFSALVHEMTSGSWCDAEVADLISGAYRIQGFAEPRVSAASLRKFRKEYPAVGPSMASETPIQMKIDRQRLYAALKTETNDRE